VRVERRRRCVCGWIGEKWREQWLGRG
jgi:hypothetical protein